MDLLEINGLSHTFADNVLYQPSRFRLFSADHMGVTGENGAGKSTFLKIISGEVYPEAGNFEWKKDIQLGYLDQHIEVASPTQTVLDYFHQTYQRLYDIEKVLQKVYHQMEEYADEEILRKAGRLQEDLERQGFYDIEQNIYKIVCGLGLEPLRHEPLSHLSGGQKTKVILAKMLLEQPDVMLLDEPTNHLDIEQIAWLKNYLSTYPNAYMLISHDASFIRETCNCICDIDFKKITMYRCGYDDFQRQKQQQILEYKSQYERQKKTIEKTEEFIRKNKAGNNSKIARGRQKQLSRVERLQPLQYNLRPKLHFPEVTLATQEVLRVEQLEVGYEKPLFTRLNFSLTKGECLVIQGFNGAGKTTFIKTLLHQIPALSGNFHFGEHVQIAYFEQELLWEDKALTPLRVMADAFPKLTIHEIYTHLARCAISHTQANQEIATLSGGEQSKVKLCKLMMKPSNLLILDEPTNHLDQLTKEELKRALEHYQGTILLVSHDESFYKNIGDRVLSV